MDTYQTAILTLATAKARNDAIAETSSALLLMMPALTALRESALRDLTAAQALVGTATVGIKSQLTQRAESERLVGLSALIDAIKATPTLTTDAAQVAWKTAVAASVTTPPIEDPIGVVSAIMVIAGTSDWASFLALIVAGNKVDLVAAVS